MNDVSENLTTEYENAKQEIKRLNIALQAEKIRTMISSEYTNFGLWEYDIASDTCYQYKKLNGRYENSLEPIVHFRDSMISWGIVCTEDLTTFKLFCDAMKAGEREVSCDIRVINDNCDIIWERYEGKTVYDDEGNPVKVVGRTLDVTQEKGGITNDTNSQIDPLTGTFSTEMFRNCINEKRSGKNCYSNAALMCIGIDKFLDVEARLGADYGDYIQKTVAKLLISISATERDCLVTRVRDGEFLMYLGYTESKAIDRTARRVIEAVRDYMYDGEPVTVSIGISVFKINKKLEDIYNEASTALSEAVQSGGDCFMNYSLAMSMKLYSRLPDIDSETTSMSRSSGQAKVFDLIINAICTPKDRTLMIKEAIKTAGLYIGASNIFTFYKDNSDCKRYVTYNSFKNSEKNSPGIDISCSEDSVAAAFGKENSIRIYNLGEQYAGIKLTNGAVCAECRAIRYNGALRGMLAVVFDSRFELSEQDICIIDDLEKGITFIQDMHEEYISKRLRTTALDNHRVEGFSIIPGKFIIEDVGGNAAKHYDIHAGDICYKKMRGRDTPCENCPAVQLDHMGTMFASSAYYSENEQRWLDVTASVSDNINGETRYIVSSTDITDCLGKIQMTDSLTGLMTFNVFTAEALRLTKSRTNNQGLFVFVINIAEFNRVNEEKGYETGNAILIAMAEILQRCIGPGELLCRSDGSRFTALFRNNNVEEFKSRMNLLMSSIQKQIYEKMQVNIFLLAGVCDMNDNNVGIIGAVDLAIAAQKTVRDQVYYHENMMVFYDGVMRQKVKERRCIEANMFTALEQNEFHVYYQPKVSISTGKVVGAEALVRWIRPNGEIISPGKFVPIFEENGFINEMDFAIYRRAVADIAKWLRSNIDVPLISLNVSRRHLADEDFCEKFNALVDGIGVPHRYIELEITESLLTENLEKLIEVASWFKEHGYRISIDDFGSGYSSLNLITMLPFDTLKIDGGFFLRNDLTDKNKKVITSVVSLAKSLNLETVSEGVETQTQVDFLKALGCDMIQGFFYYKPMPSTDFENVLISQEKQ